MLQRDARGAGVVHSRKTVDQEIGERRAGTRSTLRSCWRARLVYSILQAKVAHHFVERVGARPAFPQLSQALLSQVQILKVLQMTEDGLARVERLGATGRLPELLQALLNVCRQADR